MSAFIQRLSFLQFSSRSIELLAVRALAVVGFGLMLWTSSAEDLTVLDARDVANPPSAMLAASLHRQAFAALDRRKQAYEELKTPEQISAYQARLRKFFLAQLGAFPERTPLNAQVTGALDGGDYRVEKVVFESQPHHHVTALLYLPKGQPPFPGVLVPCGHMANGKAYEVYQRISILLAKNGLAALCYDPIGQGERAQILKPDGKAMFDGCSEHTLTGIGAILLGANAARYLVWDGMRGLDYLQSRPEIDPRRLGCTGQSGGGTLTSSLMALDDRIVCAAPSCYLTTLRSRIAVDGEQDAEQNIYGQVAFGMEEADYVLMRTPKPTLICSATHDFFDITGTWDTFREAKRLYTRMGFAQRVDLAESDSEHAFNRELRTASARWLRRWLLGKDDEITEPDFPVRQDAELQCTPQGQAMRLPGERSVFDMNAEAEKALAAKRLAFWKQTPRGVALQKVRELAGVRRLAELPGLQKQVVGTVQRGNVRIEKLVLTVEPGIRLPALAFIPPKPNGDAFLYLNGQGKQADAGAGGPIDQLAAQGHLVLAVDLRGLGETQSQKKWYGGSFGPNAGNFYLAYLLGQSLVGLWTEDVLVCSRFLASYETNGSACQVHVIGVGNAGIPALHAAALEPQLFASVALRRTLISWSDVVRTPAATNQLATVVHGALGSYDLPDLVKLAGAGKLTIEEPVDALDRVVPARN